MKKVIVGVIIGIVSFSIFSSYGMGKVIPKKTPMQNVGNGPYCWTPDGKVAFYRLIDYWIKMEPDPFPGGGGVYDDYKKDDEGFIVVRDPNTKEEKVLFRMPYKGAAGPAQYMDWSNVKDEILLSCGELETMKPDGSNFRVVVSKEGGFCFNGTWSPDGKQIVYQGMKELMIYIVNADGTGKRLLVEGGQNPWWSPDGKWVIYGVTAVSLDGKERRQMPIVKDIKPPYHIIPGTNGLMTNRMKLMGLDKVWGALDLRVLENENKE